MTFIPFIQAGVRGFLHTPENSNNQGFVLTHGAGGNCASGLLVKVAEALTSKGYTVLRIDLPFRQRRPTGPPGAGAHVQDQANIQEAAMAMRAMVSGPIFIGGQSYGGRQATLLAAEHPTAADGLLLLSYPLHAPGKTQMRTQHFPALKLPALFVQGTRDPFASAGEIRGAVTIIPARTSVSIVEGAGHDLKSGKFDIEALVIEPFQQVLEIQP